MGEINEYKIKVIHTTNVAVITAVLFGNNDFLLHPNHGSSVGINIEVEKNGKPISYISLLHESATVPLKITKTSISGRENQIWQVIYMVENRPPEYIPRQKPFFPTPVKKIDDNTYLYSFVDEYRIDGDTHLFFSVFPMSTTEITLTSG